MALWKSCRSRQFLLVVRDRSKLALQGARIADIGIAPAQ